MTQPVLRVTGAAKFYGEKMVLRGATLDVFPGELLALLGPNGAGKTTLIRAICGRHRLDAGSVRLNGHELAGRIDLAQLGFVPQDLAIYPDLTARQNLEVFGRLHGVSRSDLAGKVAHALEWTQLADRSDDLVGAFSGGMKRRLNIACGVLHDPVILLLDEPTVGVDPQSRERIFEMLTELTRRGTAILLTTHQLDEAQTRCDRIVIFDDGQVIASGTLDELIRSHIGTERRLTVETRSGDRLRSDTATQTFAVNDVARDLSSLLMDAKRKGIRIERLNMEAPSLQDVFLQLTGRELRE